MKNRCFLVHCWGGHPEEGWFPWLKKELEANGFDVFAPEFPDTEHPRIQKWVSKLSEIVGSPDKQSYFVGHSMGCQTIARYLESLPQGAEVGGAVFVAGFFKRLTGLDENPEDQETKTHWLSAPVDFEKVKSHLPRSIAVFSDNDPYVPLDNQDDFRDKLGSKIIIEKGQGHFSGSGDGICELPVVLEAVLQISFPDRSGRLN